MNIDVDVTVATGTGNTRVTGGTVWRDRIDVRFAVVCLADIVGIAGCVINSNSLLVVAYTV